MITEETKAPEVDHYKLFTSLITFVMVVSLTFTSAVGILLLQRLQTTPSDVFQEIKALEQKVEKYVVNENDANTVWAILEAQGAAVVGLDTNGRINLFSDGAEKLFGHEREDCIGYGIAFLIPAEMRQEHQGKFTAAMIRKGKAYQHQVDYCMALHKDGKKIPVEILLWVDPNKSVIAIFTPTEDTAHG